KQQPAARPSREREPLMVMLAVRSPEFLTAERPGDERGGGVDDEGRKDEHREPRWPESRRDAMHAERGGEKSERDGARVAEKHARRRKIVRKEAYVRGRDGGGGERHDGRASRVRGHGQRAETDHRHAAGKSVGPIHEV